MDPRNSSINDIDWNDPMFASSSTFEESMTGESPYGSSAFNDFTNFDTYADSPGITMRTPSKLGRESTSNTAGLDPGAQPLHPPSNLQAVASAESSSQDSASDSSSRRKRKVTTESPMSDAMTEQPIKDEVSMTGMAEHRNIQQFDQAFTRPMHDLSLEQEDSMGTQFDFNSATSSPIQPRDFNTAMSLNPHVNMPSTSVGSAQYRQSPLQTINPGMFQVGPRDDSPVHNAMMFNHPSPSAIFSTPSSDSNDAFAANPTWNPSITQNPGWPQDFNPNFASPGALAAFTPSPVVNGAKPAVAAAAASSAATGRSVAPAVGRSPLHIAPISTKSRVETQINVIMTIEKPPPSIEHLHLPLHTIAKSKLLAKEEVDPAKTLELHTMLVCTSAMHNPQFKEKALQRAGSQSNAFIQQRAEQLRDSPDEEKNDMKNVSEEDKPANGGEVRICNNCIQRERKRAGRKKLKKEEEQQHWERFETERVVVFNSNEYLPFKPFEPNSRDVSDDQQYSPPDGALQVTAAMRIACYCRHQTEKEGFRVIFTLKDHRGNVVAQQMSDSILITDDHKTHPPSFSTTMPSDGYYPNSGFASNGLQSSYSMVGLSELPSQSHPFTSSRSTGNLQGLAYGGQQYNPHSHVHQLPNQGFTSGTTSATMTPTSLSRPGSPSSAGHSGPNKKRKSSTFHKRVPSGLQMTPRVDTNQGPSSNNPSATGTLSTPFSPTNSNTYGAANDQSYMTISHNGGAQYFGSGPPTPSESLQNFNFSQPQIDMARAQNAAAYFSHPSSAVPSRASSPVLQQRTANANTYAPRQPIQTPTNSIQRVTQQQAMFAANAQQAVSARATPADEPASIPPPTIVKITPAEGPSTGGTEVAIYGYNFTNGIQVKFGDQIATTVFYGAQSLLATSPPSRAGGVDVTLVSAQQAANRQYSGQAQTATGQRSIFTYTDTNPRVMEMALRFLSQQHSGNQMNWNRFTNDVANQYLKNNIGQAGIHPQNYGGGAGAGGGNMMTTDLEDMVLNILDLVHESDEPRMLQYDMQGEHGETMLSLACGKGMHRVAAALLARGANPDVRDRGGYTPLMHAALYEQPKTFELLLVRGADPTIRSLVGYAAIELVPVSTRADFDKILRDTQRSRISRPPIRSRSSTMSFTSSTPSWDISSASLYESELASSAAASRRPSGFAVPNGQVETNAVQDVELPSAAALAAMAVWRDTLAAQIHHFQQSVQANMSNFHLPTLPPLPEYYQDNAMVRRLSSLVPGRTPSPAPQQTTSPAQLREREGLADTPGEDTPAPEPHSSLWDYFSAPTRYSVSPPPAYTDLYPEDQRAGNIDEHKTVKEQALRSAVLDAVADEKCRLAFETHESNPGSLCEAVTCKTDDHARGPSMVDTCIASDGGTVSPPLWLVMSLLVALSSIALHVAIQYTAASVDMSILRDSSGRMMGEVTGVV